MVIPAGSLSATVALAPINNIVPDGDRGVTVAVTDGSGYQAASESGGSAGLVINSLERAR